MEGADGETASAAALAAAEDARRLGTLTARQALILELVCKGLLNKQIAFRLGIAETTVKAHISAILKKLGVRSRTQAVLTARRAGHGGAGAGASGRTPYDVSIPRAEAG